MKKLLTTLVVVLAVGLAMVLIGGVLNSVTWTADFDGTKLASALTTVGYIVSVITGVVLAGTGVAYAISTSKSEADKKDDKKD